MRGEGTGMQDGRRGKRVLIYSHDSLGLGHLRRCREIAHTLADAHKSLSVLILSGSPIIGSFDFRARVDFVRVPGVIKLRNGDYTRSEEHTSELQSPMRISYAVFCLKKKQHN